MPSVAELLESESARLFLQCAKGTDPLFDLSDDNATAIAQICQRLDGLPLAIEIAAGRVNVLTAEQIASRLDDVFHLLGGARRTEVARHQSLKTAIDWSFALLSPKERILLGRLSVFSGSFSLQSVETVCAVNEEIDPPRCSTSSPNLSIARWCRLSVRQQWVRYAIA